MDDDEVQRMLKVYKEHLRCENIHDAAAVVLTCTEDCKFSFAYLPGLVYHKREGAKKMYELLFKLFPDFHYAPVDYIIGTHGIAALGEITGHLSAIQSLWKALGMVFPWLKEGEPDKQGATKFRQAGWIGWDSEKKLFTGERFYLFFKDAKKHLKDDTVKLEWNKDTSHTNPLDALESNEKTLDMSAKKAAVVEKLWNEGGKAPDFDSIFADDTKIHVTLNEKQTTFDVDKAKKFYKWIRPADGPQRYYLIIAGVQGVMISSIQKDKEREKKSAKDGTKRKRRKEFVAILSFDEKSGRFNKIKIDLNHKSIPGALGLS